MSDVRHAPARTLRAARARQERLASYVPADVPNRTAIDGLHHAVVSAAIEVGVAVALHTTARDEDREQTAEGKRLAIQRLNEAEMLYGSALDRALPVGGRTQE